MRTLLAVLALVLTLSACGDDDEPISSGGADDESESSSASASETTGPVEVPEGPEVCELADEADVEAAFAEDLGVGTFSSGSTDEDGVQWQSDNCNWEVDEGTEVSLEVSTAEDFTDGQLQCPELDSFDVPSTPVEGLDAEASWVNDKIDPNEGTLRICTDTYLLGIDVESPDGSRDPETMQSQAVALAEVVLANLG
ncbi:MAG TPA: hypothetical protein VFO49_13460 [Nocardioides sp.]|nr:hypothetical protein [Nocardioides sp.]